MVAPSVGIYNKSSIFEIRGSTDAGEENGSTFDTSKFKKLSPTVHLGWSQMHTIDAFRVASYALVINF